MKLLSLRSLVASGALAAVLLLGGCGGGGSKKVTSVSFSQTTLAAATDGVSYSQTLTATGGTAPYTWTVSSGSLPAGLTLSSAGVLSGTPTVSGTFTFSITVADSSSPVQSATASYTLRVAAEAQITITASSLPAGTLGAAYSQTLTATGGTTPYTWSVSSGSLPTGLTLSSAGVLSGTPTAVGTFMFSVTVTDASTPALTATASYTVVVAAAPISISAPTLPAGTVNVAYSQTLVATGGTPPYTWTLASGTLPAGLTLSSAGVLSGTPTTAGSYSFAFTVTDSSTPVQTATTGTLTLVIAAAPLTGNALLQGQYFFKFDAFADASTAAQPYVDHQAYIGSLIFDGAGNITGNSDFADDDYDFQEQSVTGTYSIGNDGRGTVQLILSVYGNYTYAIALGAAAQGSVATQARLVETDGGTDFEDGGIHYSTGFLQLQDPSAFVDASLVGNRVFGLSGDSELFDEVVSLTQRGGLDLAGLLVVGNDLNLASQSTADIATNQVTDANVTLAGSVAEDATAVGSATAFSTYGRAILSLTTTAYPDGVLPATSVIYIIDANTAYVISEPGLSTEPLYSGYLVLQSGAFTQASLTGSAIAFGSGQNATGQATYTYTSPVLYGTSEAIVSRYTADGAGNLATITDANIAGSITSATAASSTYTVAANGRVTFAGSGAPVLWLSATNTGFLVSQPPAEPPLLLTLAPQAATTYSTASLNGNLLLGTEDLASYLAALFSGEAQADGAGNVTGTLDFFSDDGAQFFGSNAIAQQSTVAVDATGRATFSGTYSLGGTTVGAETTVFYLLSPNEGVGIDESASDPTPTILTLEPGLTPASASPCTTTPTKPRWMVIHPDC